MSIDVPTPDRILMSQRERDVLKVMHAVLRDERTQAEASRLLDLSVRQVRRLQRKLQAGGDAALVHGLRGRPSNHQADPAFKRAVLRAYRQCYADFGPTFASEKLHDDGLDVCPQTLRRWLHLRIDRGSPKCRSEFAKLYASPVARTPNALATEVDITDGEGCKFVNGGEIIGHEITLVIAEIKREAPFSPKTLKKESVLAVHFEGEEWGVRLGPKESSPSALTRTIGSEPGEGRTDNLRSLARHGA